MQLLQKLNCGRNIDLKYLNIPPDVKKMISDNTMFVRSAPGQYITCIRLSIGKQDTRRLH
jgi:hypothetical protein